MPGQYLADINAVFTEVFNNHKELVALKPFFFNCVGNVITLFPLQRLLQGKTLSISTILYLSTSATDLRWKYYMKADKLPRARQYVFYLILHSKQGAVKNQFALTSKDT